MSRITVYIARHTQKIGDFFFLGSGRLVLFAEEAFLEALCEWLLLSVSMASLAATLFEEGAFPCEEELLFGSLLSEGLLAGLSSAELLLSEDLLTGLSSGEVLLTGLSSAEALFSEVLLTGLSSADPLLSAEPFFSSRSFLIRSLASSRMEGWRF